MSGVIYLIYGNEGLHVVPAAPGTPKDEVEGFLIPKDPVLTVFVRFEWLRFEKGSSLLDITRSWSVRSYLPFKLFFL